MSNIDAKRNAVSLAPFEPSPKRDYPRQGEIQRTADLAPTMETIKAYCQSIGMEIEGEEAI